MTQTPGRVSQEHAAEVPTPHGPGRLILTLPALRPVACLLLGHGAGGGIEAPDLVLLADRLPPFGIAVVRYEQPWRVAGRRVAARPAVLDECWRPAVNVVRSQLPGVPLVTGGRSAGARVACRTASACGAHGVLCLAFPLHPPGKPEASRIAELLGVPVPRLVVQGSRDPFGSADDIRAAVTTGATALTNTALTGTSRSGIADITVLDLTGARHDLTSPRSRRGEQPDRSAALWDGLVDTIAEFVHRVVSPRP